MVTNQKLRQAKIAKWTSLLNDQAASGLKVTDWCKENNLSIHAYYYWKRIIKEEYIQSILPEIVPISSGSQDSYSEPAIIPTMESHDLRDSHNLRNHTSSVTISIGDTHIEIGASASDEMIFGIIKAVRYA